MSGQGERQERNYYCPDDHTLLLISDLPAGIIRAVRCDKCGKRHTIYLGGRQTRAQLVSRNADGTPRAADAPPPIETRTVVPRRRG